MQIESMQSVRAYMDFAKESGGNTVILCLEDTIKVKFKGLKS